MQRPGASAIARRLARKLPVPVRQRVRKVVTRLRSDRRPAVASGQAREATKPLLTVVVATRNAERYVLECLQSLRDQSLQRLEVIVVDDGSADHTAKRVERVTSIDSRVRLIRQTRQGLGAARNRGAQEASGKYLAFVNPDDTVPPRAYDLMTKTLNKSGSDFAIGALQRRRFDKGSRPAWVAAVHERDRISTTLDDFPAAIQDVVAVNKVFRRTFWQQRTQGFVADNANGDALAMVTALIRASCFDVLKSVTYFLHERPDSRTLFQDRSDLTALEDHLTVLEATWNVLKAEASRPVAAAWLVGLLENELGDYIAHADVNDEAYVDRVTRAASFFAAAASPDEWCKLHLDRRLRIWLAAGRRWLEMQQLLEYFRLNGAIPPTRVRQGRVLAELPFIEGWDPIPDDIVQLGMRQTPLMGCLERVYWNDDGSLSVEGWVYIRAIDLSSGFPHLRLWLREATSGREVDGAVSQFSTSAADRWAKQLNQSFANGGFAVRFDVAALSGLSPDGPSRWQMLVEVETQGVRRQGPLRSVLRSAVGSRMPARDISDLNDARRYVPMLDPELGFVVQVRHDAVRAGMLSADGGRVTGSLRVLTPLSSALTKIQFRTDQTVVSGFLVAAENGDFTFEVDLPVGEDPANWAVRVVDENGKLLRVSWPVEPDVGIRLNGGPGQVGWQRSSRGYCVVTTDLTTVEIEDVLLSDDHLRVDVLAIGIERAALELTELRSGVLSISALSVTESGSGRYHLSFPLRAERWGRSGRPLPSATYTLLVPTSRIVAHIGPELLSRVPVDGSTGCHGYTVRRTPGSLEFVLELRSPLTDEERGRHAQGQLARRYQQTEHEPRDSVLFQCYRGEFATDTQRALHEELVWRRSPLELLWAVSDHSVDLPDGAIPVLIGSQAWYEAVGRSRYLCQNIDFDRFFRHQPHQRYLQTFHGYPFKSMGVSLWSAQGKSPWVIDQECRRRSQAWDAVLAPSETCVEMYRREYRYDGDVLVTGYPRDDALVNSDPAVVRSRVLDILGIDQSQTVVLYAPTWRDTVATSAWTAKLFDELDLDLLTAGLGESFTLLMRGHNYNLREGVASSIPSRDRCDLLSGDQRPHPGRRRRGARLLVVAVRLGSDGEADDLLRTGPRGLHQCPDGPVRLRTNRSRTHPEVNRPGCRCPRQPDRGRC